MYENVGSKIMQIAKVLGIVELAAGFIIFCQSCSVNASIGSSGPAIYGWIFLILGALGFVFSWVLYGFGQLVDDIHDLKKNSVEKQISDDPLPPIFKDM